LSLRVTHFSGFHPVFGVEHDPLFVFVSTVSGQKLCSHQIGRLLSELMYSSSQLNEVQFQGESRDILPGLSMKAYSLDLRQKIIDTYNSEKISQRQLAKQFRVALSFVEKLLKRYRQTGEIGAKGHGGGRTPKLSPEQLAVVAQLIEAKNDATLEELCEQFAHHHGVSISRATMGRVTQQLNLTVKKNAARYRTRY
jgi:transposase